MDRFNLKDLKPTEKMQKSVQMPNVIHDFYEKKAKEKGIAVSVAIYESMKKADLKEWKKYVQTLEG